MPLRDRRGSSEEVALKTGLRAVPVAVIALFVCGAIQPVEGQILNRVKDKAKRSVERRVERQADRAVEETLDATEEVIVCVVTDVECMERAEADGKTVEVVDREGNPTARTTTAGAGVGEGMWLNYDFVPGERILFVEDFEGDGVGDFPRRLEFKKGNMEVADANGRKVLRASSISEFYIPLPETLPERFTAEIDYAILEGVNVSHPLEIHFSDERDHTYVYIHPRQAGLLGGGLDSRSESPQNTGEFFPVRIMADGPHVKVYVGDNRVANVPNANLGRSDRIRLRIRADRNWPKLIGSLRIAAGGEDLYDALARDGRVSTQGILFDLGSDRLRPESTPTLLEIARMLEAHPDLGLVVEGHTDSVGDEASNQILSEKRAEAVRKYLTDRHGIDVARLTARGFGESTPAATNETSEGRQQNRRVELVRM